LLTHSVCAVYIQLLSIPCLATSDHQLLLHATQGLAGFCGNFQGQILCGAGGGTFHKSWDTEPTGGKPRTYWQ